MSMSRSATLPTQTVRCQSGQSQWFYLLGFWGWGGGLGFTSCAITDNTTVIDSALLILAQKRLP